MIKKVAIIGMGALGLMYAKMISDSQEDVTVDFIMDKERLNRNLKTNYTINGQNVNFNLVADDKAKPYDLVIVAVKATALTSAITTMKNTVDEKTTIISVLNGITSEQIIGNTYNPKQIIYCIAQGMDAVKLGVDLTYSKVGHLLLGILDDSQKPRLDQLTEFLTACKIEYAIKEDILHHLWAKFMLNVGINQTCMVYNTNYGGALKPSKAHETLIKAMEEVIELSKYAKINLTRQELDDYIKLIGTLDPEGLPSMAQDAKNKRYSEVELFSGTVIKLAKQYGLKVPTNQFLYHRIKEIESEY